VPSIPLSILTWNTNFRTASILDPIATLLSPPDVITFQEVTLEHATGVLERLHNMGYTSVYSGSPDAAEKQYGNVIAARASVTSCDSAAFGSPWPQLLAHARVETLGGPVNVVTVHVPNGSGNGWKKIDTLDALKRMVLGLKREPLILTGDFNEPRWAPLQNGHIVTWGQDHNGDRWSPWNTWTFDGVSDTGERWDAAVRWYFEHPNESGIRNAFWDRAGHGAMEASHLSRGAERWFDHVFVSDHFRVERCEYKHSFRTDGFSDHSALIASLAYAPG